MADECSRPERTAAPVTGELPVTRSATHGMLAASGVALALAPTGLLELFPVGLEWEVELVRFVGWSVALQAVGVWWLRRRGFAERAPRGVTGAALCALVYLLGGSPLFLLLTFVILVGMNVGLVIPLGDHAARRVEELRRRQQDREDGQAVSE